MMSFKKAWVIKGTTTVCNSEECSADQIEQINQSTLASRKSKAKKIWVIKGTTTACNPEEYSANHIEQITQGALYTRKSKAKKVWVIKGTTTICNPEEYSVNHIEQINKAALASRKSKAKKVWVIKGTTTVCNPEEYSANHIEQINKAALASRKSRAKKVWVIKGTTTVCNPEEYSANHIEQINKSILANRKSKRKAKQKKSGSAYKKRGREAGREPIKKRRRLTSQKSTPSKGKNVKKSSKSRTRINKKRSHQPRVASSALGDQSYQQMRDRFSEAAPAAKKLRLQAPHVMTNHTQNTAGLPPLQMPFLPPLNLLNPVEANQLLFPTIYPPFLSDPTSLQTTPEKNSETTSTQIKPERSEKAARGGETFFHHRKVKDEFTAQAIPILTEVNPFVDLEPVIILGHDQKNNEREKNAFKSLKTLLSIEDKKGGNLVDWLPKAAKILRAATSRSCQRQKTISFDPGQHKLKIVLKKDPNPDPILQVVYRKSASAVIAVTFSIGDEIFMRCGVPLAADSQLPGTLAHVHQVKSVFGCAKNLLNSVDDIFHLLGVANFIFQDDATPIDHLGTPGMVRFSQILSMVGQRAFYGKYLNAQPLSLQGVSMPNYAYKFEGYAPLCVDNFNRENRDHSIYALNLGIKAYLKLINSAKANQQYAQLKDRLTLHPEATIADVLTLWLNTIKNDAYPIAWRQRLITFGDNLLAFPYLSQADNSPIWLYSLIKSMRTIPWKELMDQLINDRYLHFSHEERPLLKAVILSLKSLIDNNLLHFVAIDKTQSQASIEALNQDILSGSITLPSSQPQISPTIKNEEDCPAIRSNIAHNRYTFFGQSSTLPPSPKQQASDEDCTMACPREPWV